MAQYVRIAHSVDAGESVETPTFPHEQRVESDRPTRPSLHVGTRFKGDRFVVSGQTDAPVTVVKTSGETQLVEPEDGAFEVEATIEYGKNQVAVTVATHENLTKAGTTVLRFML